MPVNKSQTFRNRKNQATGAVFEKVFELMASRQGMWAERNLMAARRLPGNRVIAFRSRLDYNLVHRSGRIAFVDLKSFAGDRVTYSMLTPHQVKQAMHYESWNITSGFVIELKGIKSVFYFSAKVVSGLRPRESLSADMGKLLGESGDFNPGLIFLGADEH